MSTNMSHSASQERAFALQKYLLLHSQHDALHKHIEHITTSVPSTPITARSPTRGDHFSSSTDRESSMSSSPESPNSSYLNPLALSTISTSSDGHRYHHRSSLPSSTSSGSPSTRVRPRMIKRRSSLPAIIDENEILSSIEREEDKLHDVNEQLKCTLTDLLNCESVRNDGRYRMWVQQRLMNTERELKGERMRSCERKRRMSVAGSLSDNIGDHFH